MNIYIVIPTFNAEATIELMLDSLINQSLLPKKVIVVNDNSTDKTNEIVSKYVKKIDWINSIETTSSEYHIPGSKVIKAFNKGIKLLEEDYDIICKFDSDIVLPNNYLESIVDLFNSDDKIGIAGGLAFIKKNNEWIYEKISSKEHVRGPFKAYRKACFIQIGGLKESIGWDTADVMIARFYNWKVVTDKSLKVKHLIPTGKSYSKKSKHFQGEALYKLRYGFTLTVLSALKSAFNKRSFTYFVNTINGFFRAKKNDAEFILTKEQGKFTRNYRWKGIFKRLL